MNTYEVRTQAGTGILGMFLDDGTSAKAERDLTTGRVTLTQVGDDLDAPLVTSLEVDPLLPTLVLVVLDGDYQEVHREEVPEVGERPEGVTAGTELDPQQADG